MNNKIINNKKRNDRNTERAIVIMEFFKKRIEDGTFDVDVASWYPTNNGTGISLNIDLITNVYVKLDDILDV